MSVDPLKAIVTPPVSKLSPYTQYKQTPITPTKVVTPVKRSGGGGGPQTTKLIITPSATTGMTEESVKAGTIVITPEQLAKEQAAAESIKKVEINQQRLSAIQTYGRFIPIQPGYQGPTVFVNGRQMIDIGQTKNWESIPAVQRASVDYGKQEYFSQAQVSTRAALKTEQPTEGTEKAVYDSSGKVIAVESGYFGKTIPIDEYNRIIKVMPKQQYYNPETQKTYEESQVKYKGKGIELTTTPVKVFTTSSGEKIYDVQKYMQEQKIPQAQAQQPTFKDFKEIITEKPTYDVKSLYAQENINLPKWERETLKGVEPITAEDVTTIAFGGVGLAKAGVFKAATFLTSGMTTKAIGLADETLLPQPKSIPGKFAKGIIEGVGFYVLAKKASVTSSFIGTIYGSELSKSTFFRPIETIGGLITSPELYGMIAGGGISSKVKVRDLKIPEEAKGSYDIKLLGLESNKGRGLVIGYKSPKGYGFGTPNLVEALKRLPETTEIKLGSVLETKTILKSLKSGELKTTERAKEVVPLAKIILRKTMTTKSKFIDEPKLYEATERLPKAGTKAILDIAKEEQGVLFGSKSRAFQLAQEYKIGDKTFKLIKVPRDIELRFDEAGEVKLKSVTEKVISRLKGLGTIKEGGKTFELGTAREIKDTPYAIEAKVGKGYEKVVELKGKEGVIEKEEVPEEVIGFKKVGKTMKISGIEATRLSEELRGVSQGILRVRKVKGTEELDIYPSPKRLKDIGSVSVSARTLAESKWFNKKLYRAIEKLESLYPEELVREQVREVLKNDKVALADFSTKARPLKSEQIKYVVPKVKVEPSVSPRFKKTDYYVNSLDMSLSRSVNRTKSISPKILPSELSPYSLKSISPSSYKSPGITTYKSISPYASISPYVYKSPSITTYKSPSPKPNKSISPYIPITPSETPYYFPRKKKPFKLIFSEPKEFKIKRKGKGYDVFKILKGKPQLIARGLYKETALDVGAEETLGSLRATFFIKKSMDEPREVPKNRVFRRYSGLFRPPKVSSRYSKYGEVYIQKATKVDGFGGRLSFRGEKREIQLARSMKGGLQ